MLMLCACVRSGGLIKRNLSHRLPQRIGTKAASLVNTFFDHTTTTVSISYVDTYIQITSEDIRYPEAET